MKIGDKKTKVGTETFVKKAGAKTAPRKSAGAGKGAASDNVDLSSMAVEMRRVKAMVDSVPDIRADLVGRIKSDIEGGVYKFDTEKVAEKLIERALRNALFSKAGG